MTREQAAQEFKRLCEAMDRTPDTLRPGQVSAWLEALQDMPYETGRLAVTRVIRTWTSPRFPAPGALEAAAREITREGIPNAGAYSQDGLGPRYDMDSIRRALEQHDRWLAMSDEEYMDELERIWTSREKLRAVSAG